MCFCYYARRVASDPRGVGRAGSRTVHSSTYAGGMGGCAILPFVPSAPMASPPPPALCGRRSRLVCFGLHLSRAGGKERRGQLPWERARHRLRFVRRAAVWLRGRTRELPPSPPLLVHVGRGENLSPLSPFAAGLSRRPAWLRRWR